jgi:hypothetical protein
MSLLARKYKGAYHCCRGQNNVKAAHRRSATLAEGVDSKLGFHTGELSSPMDEVISNAKVAIVTGGSRGLGRGVAQELVARGIRVIALARDEDGVKTLARECQGIEPLGADARMVKIFKCAERSRSSMMDVESEHNHMRAAFGLRDRFDKPGTPAAE